MHLIGMLVRARGHRNHAFTRTMRIMRLTVILMLACFLHVSAKSWSQQITLSLDKVPMERVFREIKKQAGYLFVYQEDWGRRYNQPVSVNVKNATIEQVLAICTRQIPFEYRIVDNVIIVKEARLTAVEQKTDQASTPAIVEKAPLAFEVISGQVVSAEGRQAIAAVSITVKGSGKGTTSGGDGRFTLSNVHPEDSIVFSSIGFNSITLPATALLPGGNINAFSKHIAKNTGNNLIVILSPSNSQLDDVVVVGYGTMRKGDLTSTISTVKGKDLAIAPVSSAAEALTGRVAGVQVTTQDGSPGSDVDIKIRGGMSITQDNTPLYIIDGFASDVGLRGVAASDIESVEVLKDASATAIYGARGANGVILITTKGGKKGKTVISYNGYASFRKLPRKIDVLSTPQYLNLQYEMAQRAGGTTYDNFLNNYGNYADFGTNFAGRNIDWQDVMFGRTAVGQNHDFMISGGDQNHSFMLSYSRNYEDGILINTNNKRNNVRFKYDQKLTRKLDMSANILYYENKKKGDITAGNTLQNTLLYRPVAGVAYTEQELQDAIDDPVSNSLRNPKVTQQSQTRLATDRVLTGNLSLVYKFNKEFSFRTLASVTYTNERDDSFDDQNSSAAASRGGPFGSQRYGESLRWQNTNTFAYQKKWADHSINALLGNEQIFNEGRSLSAENRQFPVDNFGIYDLSLGSLPQKPVSSYQQDGLVSFFGRLFYGYKDKYLVTASLRADGSSKFAKQNRFGYFPSVSAAWRIDQESFMNAINAVNELKLRISYGKAGNNRIGNNRYSSIFTTDWYANGPLEIPTLVPTVLANPDLKWETITSSNVGLDFSLLRNRISGSIDAYQNTTRDLLLTANIPSTTGYTTQTRNVGATRNRGLEITINTVNVNSNDFRWSTSFNISFNRNKVLSLATGNENDYMLFKSGVGSYIEDYLVKVGEPVGLIYGYVYDGFYGVDDFDATYDATTDRYTYALKNDVPSLSSLTRTTFQPGSTRYKDTNGDGLITPDDRTIIGHAYPKHFGGINNTFTYKNIDLSIFMNWVYGNDVLNYTYARLLGTYQSNQNQAAALANRFTYLDANGQFITEPKALAALNANAQKHAAATAGPESNITLTQSEFVEDGSFLRINNITIGYTIPASISKRIGISHFRVYATGYNIHTFTHYSGFDPEVNKRPNGGLTPGIDWSAYPRTRSMVIGVNVNF
jgi:TonB-linked outer membrane protein, SusC/RagA family